MTIRYLDEEKPKSIWNVGEIVKGAWKTVKGYPGDVKETFENLENAMIAAPGATIKALTENPMGIVKGVGDVGNAIADYPAKKIADMIVEKEKFPVEELKRQGKFIQEHPFQASMNIAALTAGGGTIAKAMGFPKAAEALSIVSKGTSPTAPLRITGVAGKKVINAMGKGAKKVTKKVASAWSGVPSEAIEARLKRPTEIAGARSALEIADDLPNVAKQLKKRVTDGSTKAWETLNRSNALMDGATPVDDVVNAIRKAKKKLGAAIGAKDRAAKISLTRLEQEVMRQPKTISQGHLKDLIQKADRNIDWESLDPNNIQNSLMKDVRVEWDSILKTKNAAYKKAMIPVDDATRTLEDFQKSFNIKTARGTKVGYVATDTTYNKVKAGYKPEKIATQKVYDDIKRNTGVDLKQQIRDANTKLEFEKARISGSRRTLTGVAVGEGIGQSVGVPTGVGGAVGGTIGALTDIEGGQTLARLIDFYKRNPRLRGIRSNIPPALSKVPGGVPRIITAPTISDITRRE